MRLCQRQPLAAWLASYFDILFAANRILHPGEKRTIDFVEAECLSKPHQWREDLEDAVRSSDPL